MTSKNALRGAMFIALALAALLRWCVSMHPYSGQGTPPMFGDYEAQRHWMEITFNLPLNDWYFNTSSNDLNYWGLDYPPITAYHSFICGYISHQLNPAFVALNSSRGYESYEHKLFMRASVFVADFLVYIPAVWWFFSFKKPSSSLRNTSSCSGDGVHSGDPFRHHSGGGGDVTSNNGRGDGQHLIETDPSNSQILALFIALIYPGLILIDYGHFQYNIISLGLAVAAVAALYRQLELTASMLFCFALNYKQMELYHALPFFCYLLGICLPKKGQTLRSGFVRLVKISFIVILSFLFVWLPFLRKKDLSFQLIHRIFPLARGVFEDKVANVWCCINVVYKLHNAFSNIDMAKICLLTTFLAVLPSSFDLISRPNAKKFLMALINSSLAFFLFSFQVHEKSILLAAIPVTLYLPNEPLTCFWFLFISSFSMVPLLIKDGLLLAYLALTAFYTISIYLTIDFEFNSVLYSSSNTGILVFKSNSERSKKPLKIVDHNTPQSQNTSYYLGNVLMFLFFLSIMGCVALTLCICSLKPPALYPDLYPLLVAVYSAGHFFLFFLYFNYRQYCTVPT